MNRLVFLLSLSLALALPGEVAAKVLGAKPALEKATPIAHLLNAPDQYIGKKVQVKGRITEVCQMAGCWVNIVDDATGKAIRITVNDGEIVFPKDASGKQATAEGVFTKIEMTDSQAIARAKHEAEEQGTKYDPAKAKLVKTIYQIQGTGAIVDGI